MNQNPIRGVSLEDEFILVSRYVRRDGYGRDCFTMRTYCVTDIAHVVGKHPVSMHSQNRVMRLLNSVLNSTPFRITTFRMDSGTLRTHYFWGELKDYDG